MSVLAAIMRLKELDAMKEESKKRNVMESMGLMQKGMQTSQLIKAEKDKANLEMRRSGFELDPETGRYEPDEDLMEKLGMGQKGLIQRGKVSDALLKMQEAKDAGLITDEGTLREFPSSKKTMGADVLDDSTVPQTYGEDRGESEFITTQIKAGTRTIKNIGAAFEEKKKGKALDIQFKEAQEAVKGNRNFLRTVSLFSGLVAQIKGKREEQEGELGLIPGMKGALRAKLRRPGAGRIAAFAGQRRETSFALNSILTGQNRVIRGVIHMILETLPDHFDPEDMAAAKITQSITNAYKLTAAFRKGILDVKDIENLNKDELKLKLDEKITLSSQEQEVLDSVVNEVLMTPATKPKGLLELPTFSSEEEANKANLRKGQRFYINGRLAIWE